MNKSSFKSLALICIVCLLALAGCSTDMAPENAQVIKVEVKKGNGKASGMIKAASPGTAGISSKRFEFEIPGSVEVKGGPSEYTIQFDSSSKEMRQSTVISLDGRELKKGKDMVWEDDKGPRITLVTEGKKADK